MQYNNTKKRFSGRGAANFGTRYECFFKQKLHPKFPQSAPKARPRPAAPRLKKGAQARAVSAVAWRPASTLSVQIACIFSIFKEISKRKFGDFG